MEVVRVFGGTEKVKGESKAETGEMGGRAREGRRAGKGEEGRMAEEERGGGERNPPYLPQFCFTFSKPSLLLSENLKPCLHTF